MNDLLPLLIILLTVGLLAKASNKRDAKNMPKKIECDLHKWSWVDQPGMENVSFMKCSFCGMLPISGDRE